LPKRYGKYWEAKVIRITNSAIIASKEIQAKNNLVALCREYTYPNYGLAASCPPNLAEPLPENVSMIPVDDIFNMQIKGTFMKYYAISTSKSGHGAIFTNSKEAKAYLKTHPDSAYTVFDRMPVRIPSIRTETKESVKSINEGLSDPKVTIYTDGSALNNPGSGGYGIVIMKDGETIEISQGYRYTTNNRMEMMAVITALEGLEDATDRPVTIFSDSQYTINGVTKGWAKNWRKKGWKKSDGKPALNPDLWGRMLDVVEKFPNLSFEWVRGHAGDPMNELADELANGAAHGGELLEDVGYK
jgi:ribonuclease HI